MYHSVHGSGWNHAEFGLDECAFGQLVLTRVVVVTVDAPLAEPGLLSGLSRDLADAGFSIDGVAGFLGEGAYAALNREYADVTKIIIAQRIASVRNADRIVVLDGGTISDCGSHDELMARSNVYRDIYYSQLKEEEAL